MTDIDQRKTPAPESADEPSLRTFLPRLVRGENLASNEAAGLLNAMLGPGASDAQIAAALTALATKGETVDELFGMAEVMRERVLRIKTRHDCFIDTAGTGSSRAKTFNVSTAAAFVIAGAGLPVAKHGNRAAASRFGSADVLSALGVNVSAAPSVSQSCLDEVGICFMFAPLYHGATARVASVRRELGVPTTFNLLGPLTNPAAAPRQVIGVWHRRFLEPVAETLLRLGTEHAWVVHGVDGLDEITLAGTTFVAEATGGRVKVFEVTPGDFGYQIASLETLRTGNEEESARTITEVLTGARQDTARSLVVANAAAALFVGGRPTNLAEAARLAEQSIDTGAASSKLKQLVAATNRVELPNADR